MQQIDMPPRSVRSFVDWLVADYRNEDAPLGSIELLASSSPGPFQYRVPGGTAKTVEAATTPRVMDAFERWYEKCNKHVNNVAIFYFCGHGVNRGVNSYLLLEDWGAHANNPMHESIDLLRFQAGMKQCRAQTQFFISDACRVAPWAIMTSESQLGQPLIVPDSSKSRKNQNSTIVYAAGEGLSAFGEKSKQTYFTRAFIAALEGAAAERDVDRNGWRVNSWNLVEVTSKLLQWRLGGIQSASLGGDSRNTLFTMLHKTPMVPVDVKCEPPAASRFAALTLACPHYSFGRSPELGTWELTAPICNDYLLAATFRANRYRSFDLEVGVTPPLQIFTVTAQ
ncbi:caspase family protein [Streptomyces sp. WAC05374]|uniref:caspase family protein n=1 Tax=Streptomyces sp. WAC05374 TaxID=2487420 RepID=UPI00135CE9F1|nr:caspase family protein [Streptomyces sp. WAC05374]